LGPDYQSFAALDEDTEYKQAEGSVELPTQACFPDMVATPLGLSDLVHWNSDWIEAGGLLLAEQYRYDPSPWIRRCVDRWCLYSTAADQGAVMALDQVSSLVPGARPMFRVRRMGFKNMWSTWLAEWSNDGGQTYRALRGARMSSSGLDYVLSGLEDCCATPALTVTIGTHDRKDNRRQWVSGGSLLLSWMFDPGISPLGGPSTLTAGCSGWWCNYWTQSYP
jgi:hypothetical protein